MQCKRVNFTLLLIFLLLLAVIGWVIYIGAMFGNPRSEALFDVFRFPTHVIFPASVKESSAVYRIGLGINVLIFAFVLERLITLGHHGRAAKTRSVK